MEEPCILIAGGKDKNLSYEDLLFLIEKKVKKMIVIGQTRTKMKEIFGKSVPFEEKDTLNEAVLAAYTSASSGDTVLLSPMCSSFDMFLDYKDRGDTFKKAVESLKAKNK